MPNAEKLHYDYGSEFEEGEESSWLWIAEMKTPHCLNLIAIACFLVREELVPQR
ncbi:MULTISPECIES: hypothetical protein [Nostoc]|uniref:Uncharacterized protein n=1 Tax=Nostoc paludosum FACHB-159 TaxID=2692908 RepID=A0ABR8KM08_9NOSO|nr:MULTISPECIES: hypothetical protein [Nostoc]MBD2683461.1 hypothetical protein [Nostoc sp. FACHB-857]MBD2739784.1 hypothetical protein [Nostoc paludosum FACHB-159]